MKSKVTTKLIVVCMLVFFGSAFVMADMIDPYGKPPKHKLGYRIWKSGDGEWHIRMSAKDKKRRFKGSITCVGEGRIKKAWAVAMENRKDHGGWNERQIQFNFTAKKGQDGIDWITNCHKLQFYMTINGKEVPNRVWVGKKGKNPYSIPFKLPNR